MKKIVLLFTCLSSLAFGQNTLSITAADYGNLKANNQLDPTVRYQFSDTPINSLVHYSGSPEKSGLCDCMVPLDTNFILAMAPNDDYSSGIIALPFSFDFYGTTYDSLYINNNGNISFQAPYMEFTPYSFPTASFNMIAPFWADVDTRGSIDTLGNFTSGGEVWYKITPTALIVKWENVGYFNMHTDKLSTFQLIISNGQDPLVNNGANVAFCYGDMSWTTGDASQGVNGWGGAAATVGVNIGNGTDFFQVGQFDQTGTTFDGPVNANDGVDFLDGQEIYFNIAGASSSNTPPLVIASAICDTIDVYTGDTLIKSGNAVSFSFGIMAGEIGQTVSLSNTTNAPVGAFTYAIVTTDNNFLTVDANFDATGVAPGNYTVDFVATDNGIPAGVTHQIFAFKVIYDAALGVNTIETEGFGLYPNPVKEHLKIELPKGLNEVQLEILDLTGKTALYQTVTSATQISTTSFEAGMYLVNFYQNGVRIGSEKLIKE